MPLVQLNGIDLYYEETGHGEPLLHAANAPFWIAHVLAELGDVLHRAGDVTAAVPLLDEAVEITRRSGSARGAHPPDAAAQDGSPTAAVELRASNLCRNGYVSVT